MALSCRAQAFSVDNLIRSSSKKDISSDATTEPESSIPFSTTLPLVLSNESEKLNLNRQLYKRNNLLESTHNTVFEDEITTDLIFNNSISHENIKHDFPIYRNKISQDVLVFKGNFKPNFEEEIISSYREYKHPIFRDDAHRLDGQDIGLYKFPYAVSKEISEEKLRSNSSPYSHKYRTSPTSAISTTCFCNGEISFCHHPGIVSVADNRREDSCIIAELCHAELWASFHRLGTEMIITKSGRRMFPGLKLRITGLNPDKMFTVRLEFLQPDTRKYRYIYHSSRWMVSGSGDTLTTPQAHRAPEGPISGQAICSQIVSFERLKLTNTEPCKSGQVSLVSMQKFQPQVVIQEINNMENSDVSQMEQYVIMFPQTSFMAVTAYQNQQITTLKIASNPFAKGFRESGKTRMPFDSFMTAIPNMLSTNTGLDYLPGFITPPVWSAGHCFQRNVNLNLNKRYYDRHANIDSYKISPSKVMKMEDEKPEINLSHFDIRKVISPALHAALQRPVSISMPPHPSHHHSCQLHQQHHKGPSQQIIVSGIACNLHPMRQHVRYSSDFQRPDLQEFNDHSQNIQPKSGLVSAQPPPAHMPIKTTPLYRQKQQPNTSASPNSHNTLQIYKNVSSVPEDTDKCLNSRPNFQLVRDSHFLALPQSSQSFVEHDRLKNGRSRSSNSSSSTPYFMFPPRSMTEPVKMDVNETCGCLSCENQMGFPTVM